VLFTGLKLVLILLMFTGGQTGIEVGLSVSLHSTLSLTRRTLPGLCHVDYTDLQGHPKTLF